MKEIKDKPHLNGFYVRGSVGFGLVELLVALTIVTVTALAGFQLFATIQNNLYQAQIESKRALEVGQSIDKLFLAFADNVSFFDGDLPLFEADSPLDNSSALTASNIFGSRPYFSGTEQFSCKITQVRSTGFDIVNSCFEDLSATPPVTAASVVAALTANGLPSVVLVDSQEPCEILSASDNSTHTEFTVRRTDCLENSTGDAVAVGGGVMMPRIVASATEISSDLNLVLFDHYGVDRRGAAINFGLVEDLRDSEPNNFSIQTTAALSTERVLRNLPERQFRFLMRVYDPLASQNAHLEIQAQNGTIRLPTRVNVASTEISINDNMSVNALGPLLDNLTVTSALGTISMTVALSSDDLRWVRRLAISTVP